jgi:hypothetical protein
MPFPRSHVLATFLGTTIGVALWGANYGLGSLAVPSHDSVWPSWFAGTQTLIEALASVAPGFVAGWTARSRGLAIGAIVGTLVSIASLLLVVLVWGAMQPAPALQFLFFATAAGLVTQPIGGLAGEALSARRSAV